MRAQLGVHRGEHAFSEKCRSASTHLYIFLEFLSPRQLPPFFKPNTIGVSPGLLFSPAGKMPAGPTAKMALLLRLCSLRFLEVLREIAPQLR
ncbi:MAG TPA: hypothetical protein VE251_14240, partial [Xanthobacteraceae bacterium]|nr:hypothetical protein [Xanthobacteraceae bacterium]